MEIHTLWHLNTILARLTRRRTYGEESGTGREPRLVLPLAKRRPGRPNPEETLA